MSNLVYTNVLLPLSIADKIANGVIKAVKAHAIAPITVVVVDCNANILVSKRMDGCCPQGFPQFAQAKAFTAVTMKMSSRAFRDKYNNSQDAAKFCQMLNMSEITGGKMALFPGGVVIKSNKNQVIGGVGVSGASSDEDEFVALQGIRASGLIQGIIGNDIDDKNYKEDNDGEQEQAILNALLEQIDGECISDPLVNDEV